MEIIKVDQGKDRKGFYHKYNVSKYDGAGKTISDFKMKKAIVDHLRPTPVVVKKKKDTGYFEAFVAHVTSGYRHIYCPVIN
jgi:hypothetical protein